MPGPRFHVYPHQLDKLDLGGGGGDIAYQSQRPLSNMAKAESGKWEVLIRRCAEMRMGRKKCALTEE